MTDISNTEYQLSRLRAFGFGIGIVALNERQQRKLLRRFIGCKRNESKYGYPHQGKRECARRRRQMAAVKRA